MPKRIIDGEALWLSDKIRALPVKFRPEFATILPLSLADGAFECDIKRLWSKVYAYNRPEISIQFVRRMLDSFERVGLISRGTYDGRMWGFFIGIDKPGRLPEPSKRNRHQTSGLPPEVLHQMATQHPAKVRQMFGNRGLGRDRKGLDGSRVAAEAKPLTPEIQKQEEAPAKPTLVN